MKVALAVNSAAPKPSRKNCSRLRWAKRRGSRPKMETRKSLRDFSMLIALVIVCAFFSIMSPQFLGARNLSLLMTELSITATLAMGMLLIILPGHIDLSAGSGVGLLGGIASIMVFEHGWPAPFAMGLALLAGILIWFSMGSVIVREKIPSFI